MVVDRLLLWLYVVCCVVIGLLILVWAPALYDKTPALDTPEKANPVSAHQEVPVSWERTGYDWDMCIDNNTAALLLQLG